MATGKSKRGKKTRSKKSPVVVRHGKDRRNPDEQEERHNVLCQCGWGRLNCPLSEIPENCPVCGYAIAAMGEAQENPGAEELVDVRCRCGWELPGCPASQLPVECPECAAAFSEEIVENPGAGYNAGEPGSLPNGEPRSPRGRERARLEREERERLGKTNTCPGCNQPCGTLHPLGRPEDGSEPWMVCGRCKREWEEAPGLSCQAPGSKHHPGMTCGGMLVYRWDAPSQTERLVCAVCGNVHSGTPRQRNPRWTCKWCSRPSKGGNRLCDNCVERSRANPGPMLNRGFLPSCEGCGRETSAGHGLCSACSSTKNPRETGRLPSPDWARWSPSDPAAEYERAREELGVDRRPNSSGSRKYGSGARAAYSQPRSFGISPGAYQSKTQQDREFSRALRERRQHEFGLLAESRRPRAYPVSIDWEDIEMPPTFAPVPVTDPEILEIRRAAARRAAEGRLVRPVSTDWEDIEMPPMFRERPTHSASALDARLVAALKILSFDGGGIKGIMTARILERLEAAVPGTVASADLYAGTSTGGIIALALAAGLTPAQCVDLYRANGEKIFATRGFLDNVSLGLDEFFRADYESDGLRKVLEQSFGDRRLGDLQKDVLVPALDLRRWCPKFFDRTHDADVKVVDVAMATSSAPTYFPAHGWVVGDGVTCYADGGLFANNPADSAIAFAGQRGNQAHEIHMLSFGTGATLPPQPTEMLEGETSLDWGYKQWIMEAPYYLFSALFDGSVAASHFRARQQLGGRYARIQPLLTDHFQMDDVEKIRELVNVGTNFTVDDAVEWLKNGWQAPPAPATE